MPIPAFGNGQELALLLDEHWDAHPELHDTPMNANIRSRFARRDNPFDFKYIKWLKDARRLKESKGSCVVMASDQFMKFGLSRELLEEWASESKNGVVVTGYSIEGTMARVSPPVRDVADLSDVIE